MNMKRSKRKGPFFSFSSPKIKRNSLILKYLIKKVVKVHNGSSFEYFNITKDFLFFKIGSFFFTRKKFKFKK